MRDCKKYQSMIKDFDLGRLSCNDEEEFEIYYIIEYGLDDMAVDRPIKKEYKELLDKYDFKGLIDKKIKDSRINIATIKKHNKNVMFCFGASNVFILLTFISYIIIKFF